MALEVTPSFQDSEMYSDASKLPGSTSFNLLQHRETMEREIYSGEPKTKFTRLSHSFSQGEILWILNAHYVHKISWRGHIWNSSWMLSQLSDPTHPVRQPIQIKIQLKTICFCIKHKRKLIWPFEINLICQVFWDWIGKRSLDQPNPWADQWNLQSLLM